MALQQAGNLAGAEAVYREILASHPDQFEALHFLGVLQAQRGQLAEAETLLARSLRINATIPDAFVNHARVLHNLNRAQEAVAACNTALALAPDTLGALVIRCNALRDLGRYEDALASIQRARALNPAYFVAAAAQGDLLRAMKRSDEALACYDQAIGLNPGYPQAWCNRAAALSDLGRRDEALTSCDRALAISPDFLAAVISRGTILRDLARHDEAIDCYRKAVAISPDHAEAHHGLGLTLLERDRPDEALEAFRRALAIRPDYAEALYNCGVALHDLDRHAEALASYQQALALEPDMAAAHWNEAAVRLSLGDLAGGFEKFEWRWKVPEQWHRAPAVRAAPWRGEDLAGRSILVFMEQGMGDVIQFVRYLPLLAARGAKVTFFCDARLMRLLRPITGGIQLISRVAVGEAFDYQCALLSLPHAFKTELASIPAAGPYLTAEPDRVARWKERIGAPGLKVGIVWQGNPLGKVDRGRSIALAHYAALARVPGVRLISLQKVHGLDQLARLPADVPIENLGAELDPAADWFVDAAAAMMSLDLIVTSDTSIAHLAGALGRPTWVALKLVADWRWLRERTDCPWYPTMRLFRQTRSGDWAPVFAAIARELQALVQDRGGH